MKNKSIISNELIPVKEISLVKKKWQSPEIHDWMVENNLNFKGAGLGIDGSALKTYTF